MSSNAKRFRRVLRSDTKRRQSMDRFGDDLCELLLSYLSFEDKFRFECVSKQWKRLIFNKQEEVVLKRSGKVEDVKTLKSVVKKCRNIRSIVVDQKTAYTELVFRVINKYCHYLRQMTADFQHLDSKTRHHFIDRFGSTLKTIGFYSDNSDNKEVLELCPNVRQLDITYLYTRDLGNNLSFATDLTFIFNGSHLLVSRLKSFKFIYSSEAMTRIAIFVENNKNTLRALDVRVEDKFTPIRGLLISISMLSKLKSLSIDSTTTYVKSFRKFLLNLGQNFKQLTKIVLTIDLKTQQSIEGLKQLKNLTHIRVDDNSIYDLNSTYDTDLFFDDIDKNLPKLQNIYFFNTKISNKTMRSLARLPALTSVVFKHFSGTQIGEREVFKLIDKCLKVDFLLIRNKNRNFYFDRYFELKCEDVLKFRETDDSLIRRKLISKYRHEFYAKAFQ